MTRFELDHFWQLRRLARQVQTVMARHRVSL